MKPTGGPEEALASGRWPTAAESERRRQVHVVAPATLPLVAEARARLAGRLAARRASAEVAGPLGPARRSVFEAAPGRELGQRLPIVSAPTPESDGQAPAAQLLRRRLYGLQDAFRPHTRMPRVGKCGRVRHDYSTEIRQWENGNRFDGVVQCKVKSCATCIGQRRKRGAAEVDRTIQLHREQNPKGQSFLLTLTLSHGLGDDLKKTHEGMRSAWQRVQGMRSWGKLREEYGIELWSASEGTFGDNGWHPHMHIVFVTARGLNRFDRAKVKEFLWEKWQASVEKKLGWKHMPNREHGVDFRPCHRKEYISKLGLEMSDPGTKKAKGRKPLDLLAAWADDGDEDALHRYQEYERAMHQKNELNCSKGLRPLRAIARAQLDAEYKAQREATTLTADIPGDIWDALRDVYLYPVPISLQDAADAATQWMEVSRRTWGAISARALLLEAADSHGAFGVIQFVRQVFGDADALRVSEQTAGTLLYQQTGSRDPPKPKPPPPPQLELSGVATAAAPCRLVSW